MKTRQALVKIVDKLKDNLKDPNLKPYERIDLVQVIRNIEAATQKRIGR